MASFSVIGGKLICDQEIDQEELRTNILALTEALSSGQQHEVNIGNEAISTSSLASFRPPSAIGTPGNWQPIGLGKSLTVDIRSVYVGSAGGGPGRRDLALLSSLKSSETFGAGQAAVQLLDQARTPRSFARFDANRPGTRVVYHTPAVTDNGTILTIDMAFDNFPERLVEQVASIAQQAAGIPLFAAGSLYLLAASAILRITGTVLENIIDRGPSFTSTLDINFDLPGYSNSTSGLWVLVRDSDREVFRGYELSTDFKLVKRGVVFNGNEPYVVISMDGANRPTLKDFAPRLATAAELSKYLKSGSSVASVGDSLLQAFKFYNDFENRKHADQWKQMADDATRSAEDRAKAQLMFEAFKSKILTDYFKI